MIVVRFGVLAPRRPQSEAILPHNGALRRLVALLRGRKERRKGDAPPVWAPQRAA